jgi:hypothetical protein
MTDDNQSTDNLESLETLSGDENKFTTLKTLSGDVAMQHTLLYDYGLKNFIKQLELASKEDIDDEIRNTRLYGG